ncbi:MAG TPA: transglycosylase SLT domain-containing protein [Microcella sp.]|nr:transglycosylase SLT domain-containing protein [Microcella sp.]
MAITTESMLLKLSPMQGLDPVGAIQQAQQMSAQRQQMRLARERFEEEKRRAEEQKQLTLLQERNEMARAEMAKATELAKKQADLEAAQQAALLKEQQGALAKAGELGGTGKAQQLAAMSPLFDQLGYDQNYVGSVGGLPAYDFVNREQEQARAEQEFEQAPRGIESWDGAESAVQSLNRLQGLGLGYPTNERGNLDDPGGADRAAMEGEPLGLEPQVGGVDKATADALAPGDADMATAEEFAGEGDVADVSVRGRGLAPASLSTGDAFARALAAQRYALETGKPARAPDEEDYMGAVPRNRIDMPAMAAETLARLKPALDARVMALPDDLRPAARRNADAIGGLGLEAPDALAEQDKAMDDAVSIYNSQQNLLAEQAKRQTPSMMDVSTFRTRGADAAKELADKRGVSKVLDAVVKADEVLRVLDDPSPENDRMIAPALMTAQGVVGVPSNTDLQFAFNAKSSLIGDIIAKVEEAIQGGLSTAQRRAIRDYLKAVKESQRQTVEGFLDSAFQRLDSREFNEHEARGYKGYIEQSVPAAWYNDYWDKREKAERSGERAPGRVGQNAPAAAGELQRQAAAAGLNGQVLGQLMGGESGGNPKAANEARTDGLPKSSAKGVFQLLDSTAQAMGFKDAAEYSAQPLEKQIEVGLKLFKNKGLKAGSPAEDYALVLAAPSKVGKWKSRDEVVYEADSPELAGNPGWRSAPGGAATVGSITDYYLKAGKQRAADADEAERKADPANPYPDDAKATELLKRL